MRKILTIDGGGIKGVFAAAFLADIEESLGEPIVDYFDLIAGTSTGGIIALGLGLGFSAREILTFYENHGPEIFKGQGLRKFRKLYAPKYSKDPLEVALLQIFGRRLLGESQTRLLVPSLNFESGEVHIFKTAHHERFVRDYKERVVAIAMATAAAPTFFPVHRLDSGVSLIDGGMWANNPMGAAAVEAIGLLEWTKGDIQLLGIGCTQAPLNIVDQTNFLGHGIAYWASRAMGVVIAAQSSSSIGTAQLLLGHENVHRISPIVSNGRFSLDGHSKITSLRALGSTHARSEFPKLEIQFFSEKATKFSPQRMNMIEG